MSVNFRSKLVNANYELTKKFTFYSDESKILQSDYAEKIFDPESQLTFAALIHKGVFWLDVFHPNNLDMNYLSKVHS